ncbi:hypothetical protein A5893_17130 [Pedobacter psychrophilus]|uniref:Uncharacterized protein n=2 Tax=Pedobacter psychrophilus TaxID=1826909 RepID=A0A179DSY3_9SPHI|nr:hypothetical protein A5893_17130 [Pedobacter psychrophilus]
MSQSFIANKIVVDTVKLEFNILPIIKIESSIPQLKISSNQLIATKINHDLKRYFFSSTTKSDTSFLLKSFLKDNLITVAELEDSTDLKADVINEFFNISYISNDFINITVERQIEPYGGKNQLFFNSLFYDLRTGNRLSFSDLFSLNTQKLVELLNYQGYRIEYNDVNLDELLIKIDANDKIDNSFLKDTLEVNCIDFYLKTINKKLFLAFKFQCSGPQPLDYGIPINLLKTYITYSGLKNSLKLWGSGINSLKGKSISNYTSQIDFENYSILEGGGYLISKRNKTSELEFGVSSWFSKDSVFYLFEKHNFINNIKTSNILDILKLSKNDLNDKNSFVFGLCQTQKTNYDSEIIALVKDNKKNPEYFNKIIKAWKANRITQKFEVLDRKKVKKCYNESYGI